MGRIRAFLFTLLGGGLTALILWMLESETDAAQRGFLIGGALFFGACTIVPASFLIPADIPDPDVDGSVTVQNSKPRAFAMALALFMTTASCVLIWPQMADFDSWKKYAFLIIPIPCAVLGLMYAWWGATGQAAYRFDKQGVTRYQWGKRTMPWSAVTGVRMLKVRNVEQVVLDVTAEHRQSAGISSQIGAAAGFGDLTLSVGATGLTPRDMEVLVLRYWKPVGMQR